MTPPSLAEQCYLAYWRGWAAIPLSWDRLSQRERRAWDQTARAAVAAWLAQELGSAPANGHLPVVPPERLC